MEIFKQGLTSEIPASKYGGKAANLSEMTNAGFNVPPGFVLSPNDGAYMDFPSVLNHSDPNLFQNLIYTACGGFPVAVR